MEESRTQREAEPSPLYGEVGRSLTQQPAAHRIIGLGPVLSQAAKNQGVKLVRILSKEHSFGVLLFFFFFFVCSIFGFCPCLRHQGDRQRCLLPPELGPSHRVLLDSLQRAPEVSVVVQEANTIHSSFCTWICPSKTCLLSISSGHQEMGI